MNLLVGLIIVVLLVAANGFFVAVEFALVAADRAKLTARAEAGSWAARSAVAALGRMSFHLSGAQLGITISSLVLGFMAEPLAGDLIDPLVEPIVGRADSTITIVLALILASVFQMIMGELIPKNIAIARAEALAMALAPAAKIVHGLFTPFIVVFNGAANWAVRRMGIEPQEELASVQSLEEIEYLIRSSGETGTLSPEALTLLTRTLRFEEKSAADALVPRVHVTGLEDTSTVGDLIERATATGHSRYPVFGEDLDDIVGVVNITDVFSLPPDERTKTEIRAIMREPHVVPETRDLVDILDDFRGTGRQLLVVVDEHGGTAGILTLEDVLEEITGDIADEYDDEQADAVEGSERRSGTSGGLTAGRRAGVTVVAGTLHRDEVEEAVGFEFPEGDFETIAGFVLAELGRIPAEGDRLVHDGWSLEIASMDNLRIASIQILPPRGVQ